MRRFSHALTFVAALATLSLLSRSSRASDQRMTETFRYTVHPESSGATRASLVSGFFPRPVHLQEFWEAKPSGAGHFQIARVSIRAVYSSLTLCFFNPHPSSTVLFSHAAANHQSSDSR